MMSTIQSNHDHGARSAGQTRALRIEPVDNWHQAWDEVVQAVARQGTLHRLRVDADGWLSARQVLMVAFVDDQPAAHVCFSVRPAKGCSIEARLDSHGIDRAYANRGIESQLHQSAVEHARSLRCQKLRGFKLGSNWC